MKPANLNPGDVVEVRREPFKQYGEMEVTSADEQDTGLFIVYAIGLVSGPDQGFSLAWVEGNEDVSVERVGEGVEYDVPVESIQKV